MAIASYQVVPPDPFTFSKSEEWPRWIRRFERFRSATGLDEKSETQVNTLIYTMGDEADDILRSFKLEEEEAKVYKTVKDKFESFFVKHRNVIYERARFNLRKQEEGESVASFINDLYVLVEHCEYGVLQHEMVRDRLVVGLRDSKLSEKLQLDATLTLDSAITVVRQSESVHMQQSVVRNEEDKWLPVGNLEGKKKPRSSFKRECSTKKPPAPQSRCTRCGRSPYHKAKSCPAKDVVAECVVSEDTIKESVSR